MTLRSFDLYRRFGATCWPNFQGSDSLRRNNLFLYSLTPSSWTVCPLKMGLVGFPETSVTTNLRCLTSKKSEDLIYTEVSAEQRGIFECSTKQPEGFKAICRESCWVTHAVRNCAVVPQRTVHRMIILPNTHARVCWCSRAYGQCAVTRRGE